MRVFCAPKILVTANNAMANISTEDALQVIQEIEKFRSSRLAKSQNKSKVNADNVNKPINSSSVEAMHQMDAELSKELFKTPTKQHHSGNNALDYSINNPNSFVYHAEQLTRQLDNVLTKIASDKKKFST